MQLTNLLDKLNSAQKSAVTLPTQGVNMILAGAGSGKTRVLVYRVAWLISQHHVPPYSIMMVTFTNKAAREMRTRLEDLLGQSTDNLWIGTFHGLAHYMLRRHWQEANLSNNFQILDASDQLRALKKVLNLQGISDSQWSPKQMQWYINNCKDKGLRSAHIEPQYGGVERFMEKIYPAYEAYCAENHLIDFPELLLRSYELLKNNKTLLNMYQNRFQFILVDEFQDINTIQYAWLKLLYGDNGSLMVVGDDDQSIYGWRGACPTNMKTLAQDYPKLTTVKLEQNYRSTKTIIKAANALIANNELRMNKQLKTDNSKGELIQLCSAFNEINEANFVVNYVRNLYDRSISYKNIAVLYRSNMQSRVLEEAFLKARIPFRIYGGQRFFERAEIKNALAYLRVISNLDDNAAIERIINIPTRGIGEKTLNMVRKCSQSNQISLWHAIKQVAQKTSGKKVSQKLLDFVEVIETVVLKSKNLSLKDTVDTMLTETGLLEYYKKDRNKKGCAQVENLEELISACDEFDHYHHLDGTERSLNKMKPLDFFLAHIALDSEDVQENNGSDGVQMMTLHSAKGLEFDIVFIVGVENELLPHRMSMIESNGKEEERRLFYVGMTRAKKQLIITYAETRRIQGLERISAPSCFIKEIPEELIYELKGGDVIKKPILANKHYSYSCFSYAKQPSKEKEGVQQVDRVQFGDVEFYPGIKVRHSIFGLGEVLSLYGTDEKTQVKVKFDDEVVKLLMLSYAKLEVV